MVVLSVTSLLSILMPYWKVCFILQTLRLLYPERNATRPIVDVPLIAFHCLVVSGLCKCCSWHATWLVTEEFPENDVTTLPSIQLQRSSKVNVECGMWKFSNVYRFRRQKMTKASKRPTHREFVKDRLLDCIFFRFFFSSKNLVQVPIECHVSRNPRHLCHASHCRSLSVSVEASNLSRFGAQFLPRGMPQRLRIQAIRRILSCKYDVFKRSYQYEE